MKIWINIFFITLTFFAQAQIDSLKNIRGSGIDKSVSTEKRSNGKRIALVIGNANYRDNASLCVEKGYCPSINDANDIEKKLLKLNFEVIKIIDADLITMEQKIFEFKEKIQRENYGTTLFYYAGHGAQIEGINYLQPVSANPKTLQETKKQSFALNIVFELLKEVKTETNIIILDACRNNPLTENISQNQGLKYTDPPENTFLFYSTAPGSVAANTGTNNRNGLFTQYLLQNIDNPNYTLTDIFEKTTLSISNEAKKQSRYQVPYFIGSGTEYYMVQKLTPFIKNNLWGYKNRYNQEIIKPSYDWAGNFLNKKAAVLKNKKWFFINSNNKIINEINWKNEVPTSRSNSKYILKIEDSTFISINAEKNQGKIIYLKGANRIYAFDSSMALVSQNGENKLIDRKTNETLQNYRDIEPTVYNLFIVETKDYNKGMINSKGKVIIDLIYDDIEHLYKNYFIVSNNELNYGVVDIDNNIIIPLKYEYVKHLQDDYFSVENKNGKKGVYYLGEKIIDTKYDAIDFSSNYFISENNDLKGIVDKLGNTLLKNKYTNIVNIDNSFALIQHIDFGYRFYNFKSKVFIGSTYMDATLFQDGLAVVENDYHQIGFIDKKGNIVIPFKYRRGTPFYNNVAWVETEYQKKWQLINRKEEVILKRDYFSVFEYLNGLAEIESLNNKYGFVNYKGEEIIPPIYDHIYPFKNNLAVAVLNNKKGIVDTHGATILEHQYEDISSLHVDSNYFVITKNHKIGLFFALNKKLIKPSYENSIFTNFTSTFRGKELYSNLSSNVFLLLKNSMIEAYDSANGSLLYFLSLQRNYERRLGYNHFNTSFF